MIAITRAFLFFTSIILLSSCGFKPILVNSSDTINIKEPTIFVPPAKNSLQLAFRNSLVQKVTEGSPESKWQLSYAISQSSSDFLITDITNVTNRNVRVVLNYSLYMNGSKDKIIDNHQIVIESGYNVTGSTFAIRQSGENAANTAADSAARRVWLDIVRAISEFEDKTNA